jgi:hypothetical protein
LRQLLIRVGHSLRTLLDGHVDRLSRFNMGKKTPKHAVLLGGKISGSIFAHRDLINLLQPSLPGGDGQRCGRLGAS